MAKGLDGVEQTMAKVLQWRREDTFQPDDEITPAEYPRMRNLSAAFMVKGMIRPLDPEPTEFVTLVIPPADRVELEAVIARWNMLWEAAQFRRRLFDEDDLPASIAKVAEFGDVNVTFVPRTRSRYFEYAPLVHLLPKHVLDRFGLPSLRAGMWPFITDKPHIDEFLPPDFEGLLSRA
ncbi:hypothetical protein ACFXNW_18115 [Nocardia sp. NPDC059180]|uniref:hypothetical protein n=1 Tax=Nocardia sp. NPDC059180 TaxID=3346761 RepID=UPI0036C4F2C1